MKTDREAPLVPALRAGNALFCLLICGAVLLAGPPTPPVPPRYQPALNAIRAKSLEGRLSFLASDLLEGRATPSRGLDIAAEYIASEFRAAGLEPAGNDGYFQTADWFQVWPKAKGLVVRLAAPGRSVTLAPDRIEARTTGAIHLENAPVLFVDVTQAEGLQAVRAETVAGKAVVVTGTSRLSGLDPAAQAEGTRRLRALQELLRQHRPAIVLRADFGALSRRGEGILVDPELPPSLLAPDAREFFRDARSGASGITLTLDVPAPETRPVKLRNVAAILKGTAAGLSNTFVLVSAHYDHLGMKRSGDGDRIYNGADDDGSGVVSVLELASAMTRITPRPRRSILFLAYFGEELGLLGSQYYARHPLVPIETTIANVNIEQVGRTDDSSKPHVNEATFTGFDYSSMVATFAEAGKRTGIRVTPYGDASSSSPAGDPFFSRSDNFPLAQRGVVSHTVCVALEFPDYHLVSDEWQKVDYDNMARVNRMIALGMLMLADSPTAPRWNTTHPATGAYRR